MRSNPSVSRCPCDKVEATDAVCKSWATPFIEASGVLRSGRGCQELSPWSSGCTLNLLVQPRIVKSDGRLGRDSYCQRRSADVP